MFIKYNIENCTCICDNLCIVYLHIIRTNNDIHWKSFISFRLCHSWDYLCWSFDKGLSVLNYDLSLNFNKQNCGRSQWSFLISKGTFDYPSDFGVLVISIYFLYETCCRLLFIFSLFFFYDPGFSSTCDFYFFKVYFFTNLYWTNESSNPIFVWCNWNGTCNIKTNVIKYLDI